MNFPLKNTYAGVPCIQKWQDLWLWEQLFARNRLRCMIELGTLWGGFSLYAASICIARGAEFYTFDCAQPNREWAAHALAVGVSLPEVDNETPPGFNNPLARMLDMRSRFIRADVFNSGLVEKLLQRDDLHPLVLFCDNGDKRREFRQFMPYLREGDFVACHDYPQEFSDEDAAGANVARVMVNESVEVGSMTVFYRVLGQPAQPAQ